MFPDSSTGKPEAQVEDASLESQQQPAEQIDDQPTGADQDANSEAQSSGAKDATEATLLDVTRKAAEQAQAKEPESSDGKREAEPEKAKTDDAEGKQAEGDKDKADEDVPFHKHPRWQEKLRKERELTRERDAYKESHERYQQIEHFMSINQLEAEEVARGFEIMALIRRDPEKALEALQPYVRDLEIATGRQLPDDLRKRVDDGVTDEDTARETARLRMEAQRRTAEADAARSQAQATVQQATVQQVQGAAAAVEQELRGTDPDFARKAPFIMDRVRALIAAERPQTPDEAAAIVRRAHSEVTEALKPMVAQRKPVTPVTSGAAATSGRSQPTSLLDAVRRAAHAT